MEQIVLLALLRSALYALVALGLTLLFGVAGVLNLAHGAFLMAAAYLAYAAVELGGLPLGFGMGLGVLGTALLAVGLHRALIRRVQRSPVLTLVVTLAVALALQELAALVFGVPAKVLPPPVEGHVRLLGLTIPNVQLAAFGLSWLAIGAVALFLHGTRLGKALRATAMSRTGAQLVGIDVERVYALAWGLSGGLAGLAGLFFAYPGGVAPRMWVEPLVIAFAIVILGGLGSLLGSVVAAYLVGFVETFTFYAPQLGVPLGAAWVGVPSLLLTVLILIVRPRGLLGTRAR